MEIEGKLEEIFETQQITATFRKREFVIEYAENPQYAEFLKFELIQDACEQMDAFKPGDRLHIHFNLRGRKWEDRKTGQIKYFNSLQAWKLQAVNKTTSIPSEMPPPPEGASMRPEDLPF